MPRKHVHIHLHRSGAKDAWNEADHEYLTGKGWTPQQIKARWDEEHKAGHPAQQVNKHNPPPFK